MKEYTHDGEPLAKAMQRLRHERPASLAGLAVCITGIVPGMRGRQAEDAAERSGARTTKNVSSRTALLVIGDNAGRAEYASVFTDDPQPREHAARLLWAVRHALADARRYGDAVSEIVSINDKKLCNDDSYRCARLIRQEV